MMKLTPYTKNERHGKLAAMITHAERTLQVHDHDVCSSIIVGEMTERLGNVAKVFNTNPGAVAVVLLVVSSYERLNRD